MSRAPLVIGTRGSKLALWQANHVADRLRAVTDRPVELRTIKTTGDRILDTPLSKIGDKGLFVKEIEQALIADETHLAVHSMKDVPTLLPDGLHIAATLEREDPRDALVALAGSSLANLRQGARVGTSSLRRRAQLLAYRPDLQLEDLRGNLDTRLRRLEDGDFDALIVAGAGVRRLGRGEVITELVSADICVPAVGQGAIAIESRAGDAETNALLARLDHAATHRAVRAERAYMRELEGGCQIPVGASAWQSEGRLQFIAVVADLEGTRVLRDRLDGAPEEPEELGRRAAARMLEAGAGEILEAIRALSFTDAARSQAIAD